MILKAYSVYDRKALVYNAPFYAPTDGAAIRIVADACNDTNTSLGRHPHDYVLFCIGEYDDQQGRLLPLVAITHVVDLGSLISTQPKLPLEA